MMKPAYIRANSVNRALEVVGDRWVLMLLQQAFSGVRRFEDFQRALGLARSTLASRLKHLVEHGLMTRRPYDLGESRQEYVLTARGKDLFATAMMAQRWQSEWAEPSVFAPIQLLHRSCGHIMQPLLVCGSCDLPLDARDVDYQDGPGASMMARATRRRRRSVAPCSAERDLPVSADLLEVLGDRWTPQVAALAFFGVRRFEMMRLNLKLATNILSDRLARLKDLGIFETLPYQERPLRLEYRLTPKGRALYPLMIALMDWGDRWFEAPGGPPLLLTHRSCGDALVPRLACDACAGTLTVDTVKPSVRTRGRARSSR